MNWLKFSTWNWVGLLIQVEMAAKESLVCDETLQALTEQLKCQVCGNGPKAEKV